ncbi:MAG: hypothetical protein MJE66_18935 [Proteobacteria bacterium]|nr:hypothetical protein [Pseudomonadota bacterium]
MATLKQAATFKHQPNLGEDVEEIAFEAGEEITILREWDNHYLAKNAAGQLFNIPKEAVEP